jgi:hypothetical protein
MAGLEMSGAGRPAVTGLWRLWSLSRQKLDHPMAPLALGASPALRAFGVVDRDSAEQDQQRQHGASDTKLKHESTSPVSETTAVDHPYLGPINRLAFQLAQLLAVYPQFSGTNTVLGLCE